MPRHPPLRTCRSDDHNQQSGKPSSGRDDGRRGLCFGLARPWSCVAQRRRRKSTAAHMSTRARRLSNSTMDTTRCSDNAIFVNSSIIDRRLGFWFMFGGDRILICVRFSIRMCMKYACDRRSWVLKFDWLLKNIVLRKFIILYIQLELIRRWIYINEYLYIC